MAAPNPAAMMNTMLSRAATRQRDVGLIDKLKSTPPLENDRAERFHRLVADHEQAVRRGDDVAAAIADDQLDRLFAEARAAREAEPDVSNVGHPAPEPISFDGGARGRRPVQARRRPANLGDVMRVELAVRQEARDRLSPLARRLTDTSNLKG